jgi:hypothetical protein
MHRDRKRRTYVSPLYRKSVLVAEGWSVQFSILSAKISVPHELTVTGKSKSKPKPKPFKNDWVSLVNAQIRDIYGTGKFLIMLAADDCYQSLLQIAPRPLKCFGPMTGMSLSNRHEFLTQCIRLKKRQSDVALAYETFERMSGHTGMLELRHLVNKPLPKQGVYFFFDEREKTAFSKTIPRLVRIGTHGVSVGSTATLRSRLRTHLGTRSALGNHRGSVFRLHVGRRS